MINAFDISVIEDTKYINNYNKKLCYLNNIKRINIFIGENNSGKSRMLRSFLKYNNIKIMSESFIDEEKAKQIKRIRSNIYNWVSSFNLRNNGGIKIELPYDYQNLSHTDFYVQFRSGPIVERCPRGLRSTTGNRVNYKIVSGVKFFVLFFYMCGLCLIFMTT